MTSLVIRVAGRPIPQGSKTPIIVWSGGRKGVGEPRAVLVEGRDKAARVRFKAWRKAIADAATAKHSGATLLGAVSVAIVFRVERPKTVDREHPAVQPDLDKLVRAVLDSLTGTVLADDAQVVRLVAEKRYTRSGEPEGALIVVARPQARRDP